MRAHAHYPGQARVTMLLTDPADYRRKELLQFSQFESVNSNLSMSDTGSAGVMFSNPRLRFFRGILRPAWARKQADEIEMLKDALAKFRQESHEDTELELAGDCADRDQLLAFRINPLDFIWIDYRGRDGMWYPGYSGMVTSVAESIRARATTTLTVSAKDYRRVLSSIPIVTGLNNLAKLRKLDTTLTEVQEGTVGLTNIFSGMDAASIYATVIETVNGLLNLKATDMQEGFWAFRGVDDANGRIRGALPGDNLYHEPLDLFYGGKTDSGRIQRYDNRPASPYAYEVPEFSLLGTKRNEDNPYPSTFYHNPLAWAFYDAMFRSGPTIYQLLIRSQINPWAIETETGSGIFSKITQTTSSHIYVDQHGILRHEYPRYSGTPNLDPDPTARSIAFDDRGRKYEDYLTPCHGLNYWVSSRDASFLDYKFSVDESEIAATQVRITQKYAMGAINPGEVVELYNNTGSSVLGNADLLKYGLRKVEVQPFFVKTVLTEAVLNRYARAYQYMLNSRARSFTVNLQQRPDTQLNRTMVFSERGLVGLIMNITDSYSKAQGHTRMHSCRFARQAGERVPYPWGDVLSEPIDNLSNIGYMSEEGETSQAGEF